MAEHPKRALKLRTVSERRHNGGFVVKVYELASSGTFTFSLAAAGSAGLPMFASATEAQQAADDRLRADGHDCAAAGCHPWKTAA
jgi:hypothetical protein